MQPYRRLMILNLRCQSKRWVPTIVCWVWSEPWPSDNLINLIWTNRSNNRTVGSIKTLMQMPPSTSVCRNLRSYLPVPKSWRRLRSRTVSGPLTRMMVCQNWLIQMKNIRFQMESPWLSSQFSTKPIKSSMILLVARFRTISGRARSISVNLAYFRS